MAANVSKCMVSQCAFNNDMQCNAPSITIDLMQDHADCDTFKPSWM